MLLRVASAQIGMEFLRWGSGVGNAWGTGERPWGTGEFQAEFRAPYPVAMALLGASPIPYTCKYEYAYGRQGSRMNYVHTISTYRMVCVSYCAALLFCPGLGPGCMQRVGFELSFGWLFAPSGGRFALVSVPLFWGPLPCPEVFRGPPCCVPTCGAALQCTSRTTLCGGCGAGCRQYEPDTVTGIQG